jgi:hypothetical protein
VHKNWCLFMARVNSPTQNLYALLAEPEPEATRPSKAQSAKRPQGKEETPAARAARNAVEKDAKLAQKKAEREKVKQQAEEAERFKLAAADFDDTGFTQQRLQRVKQAKATKVVPKEDAPHKGKGEKGDFKPKQKKTFPKDQGQVGGPQVATDSQKKEGGKAKPQGKPVRFDKHSNNPKTSKKPIATKDGAGKANWGKTPSSHGTAEATVAAAAGTTDEWEEAGVTAATAPTTEAAAPAVEGEAPETETEAVEDKKKTKEEWDEEEDAKLLTLDSYLAIKAEKQKALEALVGGDRAQPRSLTEEERNQQAKFTLLANEKNKKKTEGTPVAPAKVASNANARKGEKPIAVDQVFRIRDNRRGGRGGARPDRPPRNANANANANTNANANAAESENKAEAPPANTNAAGRGAGRGGRGGGRGKRQPYAEAYPQLGGSPLKV